MTVNRELDSQKLFDQAYALPDYVSRALRSSEGLEGLPNKDRIENIVVLGVGGVGLGGSVLEAVAAQFVPVPITVVKGYEIPAFMGEGSLVFACSFDGNTDEVVEAATDAAVQGAKIVCISGGGRLTDLAESWGSPVVRIPQGITQASAAIGSVAIPAIAVLEDVGLFPGARQWIDNAIIQLNKRRDELDQTGSIAEELATKLANKIVVSHSAGAIGAVAAERWKEQINENAKQAAFFATVPDLCNNELVGWETLAEITRQHLAIVNLRHEEEHPQNARIFETIPDLVRPNVSSIETVEGEGDGALAQLLDLVMIGDYTSLHLALQSGLDPSARNISI